MPRLSEEARERARERMLELQSRLRWLHARLTEAQRGIEDNLLTPAPENASHARQMALAVGSWQMQAENSRREIRDLELRIALVGGFEDACDRLAELLHEDCPPWIREDTVLCFYRTTEIQRALIERCAGMVGGLQVLRPAKHPTSGVTALYVIPRLTETD